MKVPVKVSQLMHPTPYQATADMTLPDLVKELVRRNIRGCPVQDASGMLVGEISLSDVAVALAFPPEGIPHPRVGDVMVSKVVTVSQGAEIATAIHLIQKHRVHRLIVEYHGRAIGIVTPFDLMAHAIGGKIELMI